MIRFVVLCLLLAFSSAFATSIRFAGAPLEPALDSRIDLKPGMDLIPISSLERFGVSVLQSSLSSQLRLRRGGLVLDFVPSQGWMAQNVVLSDWEEPIMLENQVFVNVQVLTVLGFSLTTSGDPNDSSINLEANQETPFVPVGGFVQIFDARASRGRASRIAVDVSKTGLASFEQISSSLIKIHFENTFSSAPRLIPIGGESLSRARLVPDGLNTTLELEVSKHATVQLSSLANPDRFVVDVVIPDVPTPTPGVIPIGITYSAVDKLHLVTLEAAMFKPRVVSAGSGGGKTALEYAEDANAVVAVNGGYYDVAPSLECRFACDQQSNLELCQGQPGNIGVADR